MVKFISSDFFVVVVLIWWLVSMCFYVESINLVQTPSAVNWTLALFQALRVLYLKISILIFTLMMRSPLLHVPFDIFLI